MRALSVWLVLVVAVGMAALASQSSCYSPEVSDCQYACNNSQCPSDMSCNTQNMCVSQLGTVCGPLQGDGGPPPDSDEDDAGGPGDGPPPMPDGGSGSGDAGPMPSMDGSIVPGDGSAP